MPQSRRRPWRSVYLAFEFENDAQRRRTFLSQAELHSHYRIDDRSLPAAVHDASWQRKARRRMLPVQVVIVLLGPDTQNAPGVLDELSLAGQLGKPVIQLMPRGKTYGLPTRHAPVCSHRWLHINAMLQDPQAFINDKSHQHVDNPPRTANPTPREAT